MSLRFVQAPIFYLAGSGALIGATSITVTTFTDIYGNVLTMADLGAKGYGSHEPDSTNSEAIIFTGVTANANGTYTLTGVSSALAKSPYTESSGLVRNHAGGTKFVITDSAAFWNTFGNKQNDETLIGRWGTGVAPSAGNDLVNKTYADNLAIAGSPDASTTTKGISKMSVAPVSATNPIAVGQNDPKVPPVDTSSLTTDIVAAFSGTGTPSASNKFVTADTDALKELLSNKSTNTSLGSSNTLYPSQNAVKTYVDNTAHWAYISSPGVISVTNSATTNTITIPASANFAILYITASGSAGGSNINTAGGTIIIAKTGATSVVWIDAFGAFSTTTSYLSLAAAWTSSIGLTGSSGGPSSWTINVTAYFYT